MTYLQSNIHSLMRGEQSKKIQCPPTIDFGCQLRVSLMYRDMQSHSCDQSQNAYRKTNLINLGEQFRSRYFVFLMAVISLDRQVIRILGYCTYGMKEQYDHMVKIMLLGDSGVGKTSLMTRFCQDVYSQKTSCTVGIEYKSKIVKDSNKKYMVQLWDTAGQEKFKTITPSFYRGAMAILLCYSVEDRDTFSSVGGWLKQIKKYGAQDMPIMLLANKCDLVRRQVLEKQGKAVAQQYGIEFMECSAKEDVNINEALSKLTKSVKLKLQDQKKITFVDGKNSSLSRLCNC